MRLWNKDLIPYLPKAQLLSQWRECCCIARNIAINGTPNHLLVNKVMDYPIEHFIAYAYIVYTEMHVRGYDAKWDRFIRWFPSDITWGQVRMKNKDIYPQWHTRRYLLQCFYNLQEKYDCGGLTDEEYSVLYQGMYYDLNMGRWI